MNVFGREEQIHQETLRSWQKSWQGLHGQMERVQASAEAEKRARPLGIGDRSTQKELARSIDDCTLVLANLQEFSESVFGFFHRAYSDLDRVGFSQRKLVLDKASYTGLFQEAALAPGYVLSTLLRQVSADLSNIERAFHQRAVDLRLEDLLGVQKKTLPRVETLARVDVLTRRALAPALASGLLGEYGREFSADYLGGPARDEREISVVSYSAERIGIRLLPYCDAVLIEMPYTTAVDTNSGGRETLSREFMAIPHEVGHLIFRQGSQASWTRKSTAQEAKQEKSWFDTDPTDSQAREPGSLLDTLGRWADEVYEEAKSSLLEELGELSDELYWDVRNFVTTELGEAVAAFCFEEIHRSSVQQLLVKRLVAAIMKDGRKNENQVLYVKQKAWLFDWLEEIFADTYGLIISGPKGLATFQEILACSPPAHAHTHVHSESHKHPIPILRPLIHTQIYRTLHNDKNDDGLADLVSFLERQWVAQIEANWPDRVNGDKPQSGHLANFLQEVQFTIAEEKLSGQQILEDVQLAIDVVVSSLKGWLRLSTISTWTWAARNPQATPPSFHFRYRSSAMQPAESEYALRHRPQKYVWLRDQLKQLGDNPSLDEIVEVILFRGWTDEGPRAQDDR